MYMTTTTTVLSSAKYNLIIICPSSIINYYILWCIIVVCSIRNADDLTTAVIGSSRPPLAHKYPTLSIK